MTSLNLFIPITKIDAKQRLVYGTLTEELPDKSGEIIDYESTKEAYQKWSDETFERSGGKSKGNLRAMHSNIAAGKFNEINFDDDNKRIEGVAKVVDDAEWAKVLEGVYSGFSHGGDYAKRWKDPTNPGLTRYTPELAEVSLVDNPCLATATFEFIKEDGSTELRKFNTSAQEAHQSMTTTDNTLTKDGRPQDKGGVKQVWQAKDGSSHLTKADALKRNEEVEAEEIAAPTLDAIAKLDEALNKGKKKEEEDEDEEKEGDDEETKKEKAARKAKKKEEAEKAAEAEAEKARKAKEDEDADKAAKEKADKEKADKAAKAEDKKESDVEDADEGHQEDKKKRYPIDTEEHIRAAWSYINKEKNADKYDAKALKEIKDKIVAAWKDKIDKDGPPSATDKAFRTASLKKGLHEVARMACLIQELDWLQSCLEMEAEWERDDSPLPAELKTQIGSLCGFLRALVEEETEELFGKDDDVEVMEMAAGLSRDGAEALSKVKLSDQGKAKVAKLFAELEKAGARHSKTDMERVQKMHDLAHQMHKCMGDMAEKCEDMHEAAGMVKNTAIDLGAEGEKTKEDEDKAEKAVASELSKMTTKHDALVKVISDLAPKVGEMLKRVESQNDLMAEQAKRIAHLEDQPMPAKGALRAVEKGGSAPTDEDVINLLKGKSKDEISLLLMKSALANPVQHLE